MNGPLEKLMSLDLSGGKLLILTHDNPDPDSLSSAAALRLFFRSARGIEATVGYSGVIGRAENRAMVELLDLPVVHTSEIDLDSFRYAALIDAQPHTGNSALPPERDPDIVIDHHPLREATKRARFFDVRPGIGASATIVTQYLRDAGVEIPVDLATALLYGIRTETQDLGREASEEDLDCYHFLFQAGDAEKLAMISRPRLEPRYFAQLAAAIEALETGREVALCFLERVIDPDFVPEMADFAARLDFVKWALVCGTFESKIYVSIRTNDPQHHAGDLMQKILDGIGRGGGHGMRAGGNIELPEEGEQELRTEIRRRFLELTASDNESLKPIRSHPRAAINDTIPRHRTI